MFCFHRFLSVVVGLLPLLSAAPSLWTLTSFLLSLLFVLTQVVMSTVASSKWFCSVSLCLLSWCMFNRFCSCGRRETFHHLSKWLLQSAGWMLHIYDRETDLTVRQRCLCQSWCECEVNEAGKLQLRLKLDEGGNVGSSRRTESNFWSLCSIVSVFPLFRLLLVYSLCCWTLPDFSFMSLFAINICGLWSWVTLS